MIKLSKLLVEAMAKRRKGSASPKLGFLTLQNMHDRGDFGDRFMFAHNKKFPTIYIFDRVDNGIAHFHNAETGETHQDDASRKIHRV